MPLVHLAEKNRGVRSATRICNRIPTLDQQPDVVGAHRERPGLLAFHLQRGGLVPWRTLTGRQHFYLDHPRLHSVRRALPAYKPKPFPKAVRRPDVQQGGRARP